MLRQLILILALLAVLIAPAYSTSETYRSTKVWTASGCSGTSSLIQDTYDDEVLADGTCVKTEEATSGNGGNTGYTAAELWIKATCTVATTDGWSRGVYTDSACTTLDVSDALRTETTGACTQDHSLDGSKYTQCSCGSWSCGVQ